MMRHRWAGALFLGLGIAFWQVRAHADNLPLSPVGPVSFAPDAKAPPAAGGHDGHKDEHKKDDHKKDHEGGHDDKHGHDHEHEHGHHHEEPSNLGLRDFFKTGWDEKFEERERKDRAPRFNLFKTRQGFLERIVSFNYAFVSRADHGEIDEHEAAIGFEYALNRRFEIDVEPFQTWQHPRFDKPRRDGLRWDVGARFQLIDTEEMAANFQLRCVTPSTRLDAPQTEVGFVFAGFNDLTKRGLCRTGIYYHVEYDALIGPREAPGPEIVGAEPVFERRASGRFSYSVAVAKTWVDSDVPLIADFTTFVEAFGATDVDGTNSGRTFFSLTPGVSFNVAGREEKAWWLQTGVEIPISGPRSFDYGFRIALIHDFLRWVRGSQKLFRCLAPSESSSP